MEGFLSNNCEYVLPCADMAALKSGRPSMFPSTDTASPPYSSLTNRDGGAERRQNKITD